MKLTTKADEKFIERQMRKLKPGAKPLFIEVNTPTFFCFARRGNTVLLVVINELPPGKFHALALTIPIDKVNAPEDVLDNHAHQIIGEFDTLRAAKRATVTYAKVADWDRAPRCACTDIGA